MILYSKTTGGFYSTFINGDDIPKDAVEISDERHVDLLQQQSEGKIIISDEEGNPITVDAPKPQPPTQDEIRAKIEVSAFQAHAAIARSGLYEKIELIIDNPATPIETKLAWHKAQSFKRLSPTVLGLAQMLKLDDTALDDLFELAASIEA